MTNEPNVAEWITAGSAVAGVVVSLVLIVLTGAAACFARRAARASADLVTIERSRDDRQEERYRRAQAEQVAAWITGFTDWGRDADGEFIPVGTGTIYVRNASRTPVWNVRVQLTDLGNDPRALDQPSHVYNKTVAPPDALLQHPVLESGHFRAQPPQPEGIMVASPYRIDRLGVVLTFRDAANVTWTRGIDGVLEERSPQLLQPSGRTR